MSSPRALDQALDQALQFLGLAVAVAFDDLVLMGVGEPVEALHHGAAALGDEDQDPAAVALVGAAIDQCARQLALLLPPTESASPYSNASWLFQPLW